MMLSKAHLTSHSRMSGSRSVITPSWLSGSWRSFLYSSSVYSYHLFLTGKFGPGVQNEAGQKLIEFCQENTELYKKDLHDPVSHNGVITHLEPDILECEVKWALGSITMNKARGGDRIPAELFQILKDDAVKVLHSICQQIWKIQWWPQDWKRSVFIPIPKKGHAKECSN